MTEREAWKIALTLFKAGATYEEIALKVGVKTAAAAQRIVQKAIDALTIALDQTASRIIDLERLETLHRVYWPKALAGDVAAFDRVQKIAEDRRRLIGEPTRVKNAITDALEKSLSALDLQDADEALVASCRQVARQIDHAVANGTSLEATKALYLLPHLWNGLRELGATPAARAALQASLPAPDASAETDAPKGGPVDLGDFKQRRRGSGAS
ncbi:terminase small subunit [Microbacterium maritypicum]